MDRLKVRPGRLGPGRLRADPTFILVLVNMRLRLIADGGSWLTN
jgi:hypothetical protein